jgi:hypothetical protein
MVNVEIRTLHEPDGTPVCNVAFDLSSQQLAASAHASGEMLVERHRGASLDVDGVLALRQLTSVRDELDRLADAGAHARLTLPLARFIVMHDALDEYVTSRTGRDWAREADAAALPMLGAMLGPMASLRADALTAVLGERSTPQEH